jgi:large subunit ribosomal protein L21
MVYAVVESGGKQYVARSGESIEVDRLNLKEGESVTFDSVLLIAGDGAPVVGSPHVDGAKVVGHVLEEFKGPKVIVFKYKPKIRYRKRQGHRQWYTRVAIDDIVGPSKPKKTTKKAESEEPSEKAKPKEGSKAKKPSKAKASAKKTSSAKAKAGDGGKKTQAAAKKPASKAKKSSGSAKKASGGPKKASGKSKDAKAE